MGSVKIDHCGGMLPAWDDRNLPDNQASFALNTYLYSGAAIGWRVPKVLHTLLSGTSKYAYRVPTLTQGTASANLVFLTNPNPGDQVTLGEVVYTFVTTPTNPYDVLIGSNAQNSRDALFQVANYGSYDVTVGGNGSASNPAAAGQASTIGFNTAFVSGVFNTPGPNTIILIPIVPTTTTNLNSVSMVPEGTNGGARFKAVVYENVNQINPAGTQYTNIPTTIITTGSEVVGCASGTPITSALPLAVTLQAGSTYWIGFIMDTGIVLNVASTGTLGVSMSAPYTGGPPNPFQLTTLSGITTGGTTVGTLQTAYNSNQPNWQIWGNTSVISATDSVNTVGSATLNSNPYNYINFQAPTFGTAFNQTPVSESTGSARLIWLSDLLTLNDRTTFFTGGANQVADTSILGASTWLEFPEQDTNICRTPIVDDSFLRYYFASPSIPPRYNTYQRIANGQAPFYLGIPAPPIAPVLSVALNGGGNPTQMGFPTSTTSSTYQYLLHWSDGGIGAPLPGDEGNVTELGLLVLYPMRSNQAVTINDIAVQVAAVQQSTQFSFQGVVCADISATDTTKSNAPGDILAVAVAGVLSSLANPVFPTALTSVFSSAVSLQANVQYWVGVVLDAGGSSPSFIPDADLQLALADTGALGVSTLVPDQDTQLLPVNPSTNNNTLSGATLTPNFPDLQMWADLAIGAPGEAQIETRAYAYTWVSRYGEEGPPSPPALLDAYDNAVWQVNLQPPLAEDMGVLRDIVQTNIYRTVPSSSGGTVFFFVDSVAATCDQYVDTFTDDVVAANLILPSTTWFGPPANLQGITTMPNGMIAGFRANEVWFCEPFRPHAWPAQYVMTTDYPIVGLGVVGSSLVAATQFNPQVFTGISPSAMTQNRISMPEPCTSRGSVLSTENGVYYASTNGLIKVSGTGFAVNTTQNWITREKWAQLTPQKFLRAIKNVSTYFGLGSTGTTNGQADNSVAQQGFSIELSEVADQQSFTLWPQVGGHRIGFSTLSAPNGVNVDNVLCDPWTGVALVVAGGSVYYFDFTDPDPTIQPYTWRSKKFQGPHRENFSAFRVWFDIPPGGPQTPPPVRTTVPFKVSKTPTLTYKPGMFGVIRVIADGLYITERELRYSTELMRIASADKYTTWQVEIEGIVSVSNIKLATSVKELGIMKAAT